MSSPLSFSTFVINLERSPGRLAEIEARCDAAGLSFQRVVAVDGRDLSAEDRAQYDRAGGLAWYGLPMIDAEIACYLSHLKALREFLASGARFGLVLEDDTEPDADGVAALQAVIAETDRRNIRFAFVQANNGATKTATKLFRLSRARGGTVTLYRAHRLAYGGGALLWSRAGAERFIAEQSLIEVPVDIAMASFATLHQDVLIASRPIIRQAVGESDIDDGDPMRRRRPLADYPAFRAIDQRRRDREQKIADLARIVSRLPLLDLLWPRLRPAIGHFLRRRE